MTKKHLILDKETFKKIVEKQNSEKIIIICRDVDFDHKVEIKKLSKHSINILVERDLYDIARVITKSENLKINLMNNIVRNLKEEFPMIGNKTKIEELFKKRGYKK